MKATITKALAAAALTSLVLSGCGTDKTEPKAQESAATTTSKGAAAALSATDTAFCDQVEQADGGYQPGFDAIFDKTPKPTMADWAAFLPGPTKEFDDLLTRLKALQPTPDLSDEFAAALGAMGTVSKSYHDSIAAARDGDEAEFTRLEDENQGGNIGVMTKAMEGFGAACGFPSGSS